jgi:hypothetical protein
VKSKAGPGTCFSSKTGLGRAQLLFHFVLHVMMRDASVWESEKMKLIQTALVRLLAGALGFACLTLAAIGAVMVHGQEPSVPKGTAGLAQEAEVIDSSYRVKPSGTPRERVAIQLYLNNTLGEFWAAKKGVEQAAAMSGEADWKALTDPRLQYCYGILLLKNNKYDDALKQFGSVEDLYLPAMRAKIWLNVLREKYEAALSDMPRIVRAVQQAVAAEKQTSNADSADERRFLDEVYIPWLGELVGYIAGPGAAKLGEAKAKAVQERCKTTEAEIFKLIDDRHRKLFESGRQDTLDAYAEMTGAQHSAREEGIEKQKKEQAEAKERLDETKAKLDTEKRELESKSSKADEQLRNDLASIDRQLADIEQRKKPLDNRARQLTQQINTLEQEITSLTNRRAQAITAKDTATADRLKITIDQRTTERTARRGEFGQVQSQVEDLVRQSAPLNNKRQLLMRQHEKTAGNIAKEAKGLDRRAQMVQRGQRDASKNAPGQSGKAKSVAQAATALRTYVDLDVEHERAEILKTIAPSGVEK